MRGRLSPLWPRDVIFCNTEIMLGCTKDQSKVILVRHKVFCGNTKCCFRGSKNMFLTFSKVNGVFSSFVKLFLTFWKVESGKEGGSTVDDP